SGSARYETRSRQRLVYTLLLCPWIVVGRSSHREKCRFLLYIAPDGTTLRSPHCRLPIRHAQKRPETVLSERCMSAARKSRATGDPGSVLVLPKACRRPPSDDVRSRR